MEDIAQNPQIPVTPEPIITSPPKTTTHLVILYIVIAVLILGMGFLGFEVYLLRSSASVVAENGPHPVTNPQLSPSPAQILDLTADWKTYTADKIFGLSLR
jgi:hypothetical protein